MKKLIITVTSTLLAAASLLAANLGDAASPLDIKDWVKGSPVDLAAGKGKTIYVVEFWATWCPPCRTSIPHLTEMQKKFKDQGVVFVGVSSEKTDVVKKFVDKMGDKMDYTVAVDAGKTSPWISWRKPSRKSLRANTTCPRPRSGPTPRPSCGNTLN
jgi:thiol-disulfide isomerase/thioredoxin